MLGGDSSYQIAREVTTKNNNRFDIVLLICGLPVINIEQKRTDKTIDEAFGSKDIIRMVNIRIISWHFHK